MKEANEIVLYQPDETIKLEVRLENETVWLTQQQMADLFETTPQNITMHIRNLYKEGELTLEATCKDFLQVRLEGVRKVKRTQKIYNLDVIISVGYRVKSLRGTQFRQWATRILKEYLLKGYSVNQRLERLEQRVTQTENKIEFFVKTSLPPVEGIFYDGQIFDAYKFVNDLIRSAKQRIVLIDNYIDDSVLQMIDKRQNSVSAVIYTKSISAQLQLDIQKHNAQYEPIVVQEFANSHDRFLCIDDTVYHIGASLKDLGKKWFAFNKMSISADQLLNKII
ncbi:MAG: virulence RhuM family protein [Bacteroidales bacterium]|nr:virulence RhuM family protein [Bacteroidales bacterium]MBR4327159.1 virulence RhuM family protein [Bacteroidales bacterium]